MFSRRNTLHPDVVAAARRRLAVMAAELEAAEGRSAGSTDDELAALSVDEGSGTSDSADPARDWKTIADSGPVSADHSAHGPVSPQPASRGRHADRTAVLAARERGRWDVTPQQVAIIALAVVAAVAVAAFWVLRSAPDSHPVPLATERVLPESTAPSLPSASVPPAGTTAAPGPEATVSTSAPSVVVDVAGRVRHPGIVELSGGARVVDALREAGGLRPGTDTSSLNLARLLVDGEQIVVGLDTPVVGAVPTSSTTTGEGVDIAPINLNTATGVELETLPGIGPVTAEAILAWRTEMGVFSSVDELLEVSGIGDATLADIAPYVYV